MSAPENKPDFLFKKENYTVLIIGLALCRAAAMTILPNGMLIS
jgi:hypothetical protein